MSSYVIVKPMTFQVREYATGRVPRRRLLLARQRVELGQRTDEMDGVAVTLPDDVLVALDTRRGEP